ncbi:g-protein pathway suppressor 2-interacting domain-containing protein [Phthorimaea operculella]|nr:g-protein pathway suppressor 2-interacting domain-containing protein [Phthorimaea operculella]
MVWSSPSGEVLIDIVTRPGQTDHGHGGGLAYGGKPAASAVVQPRAPSPYQYPPLRLHTPGYAYSRGIQSAVVQPRAPSPYQYPPLRLHTPGYAYRDGGYSRSGGGEYRGGARMSLLGNYLPPPAPPAHHPPPADPPPYKKIRISSQHHHQLRVDTREPVNTYNTVEVLSPNPPSEPTLEDQSFRTTKDELLQQISKVDREMALSESTLVKLKKKQEELEQTASKPAKSVEPEEAVPRHRSLAQLKKKQEELEQTASKPAKSVEPEEAVPRHRSLAQCVYAENRKKAWIHKVLVKLKKQEELEQTASKPAKSVEPEEAVPRHRSLAQLKKKQEELEQTASKPAKSVEPEEAVPRHRSLAQCVYAENRKKAWIHKVLVKLKKQEELEQTASKPAKSVEPEEAVPRHRSLAQCVYAENRKKAGAAHALLAHLGPPVLYPLYNQPQDTQVYHENIRRHRGFRKRLAEHIRRVKLEAEKDTQVYHENIRRHRRFRKRLAENIRRVKLEAEKVRHYSALRSPSPILYPLYNQPQDTQVYHENIRRHRGFRKRLAEHIRRVKLEAEKREDALAEAYSRRAAEWLRRVERIEQGQKRKVKDAKNRELFEKVFPELRKQREERERFNRLGARVKSEAELEEIADGLHEQEHEDKKMRSLTVVPPLLRDPSDHTPIYIDTNRRCLDMEAEHAELSVRNVWSNNEREVFREKYLQHPKNFGTIATFLPRKSVRDCVRFYYLSKKAENYKQLLRKPRQRRPPRAQRPQPEPEIVLTPGVTTRLQRREGTVPQRSDQKETSADESSQPPTEQPNSPSSTPAPAAPHNAPQLRAIDVGCDRGAGSDDLFEKK